MSVRFFSKALRRDERGAALIETAFVVPLMMIFAFGGFDASRAVARHMELQSAAGEASSIVLASPPTDADERGTIEDVIEASTGLEDAGVTLAQAYRCGAATATVTDPSTCSSSDQVTEYVDITINDTFEPIWSEFGIGSDINFTVTRRIQVS